MTNFVFIATSLDGYIADRDGGLGWLEAVPNPEGDDGGFAAFMEHVDAVVLGRATFEAVVGFDVGWPYPKPGLVLSSTLDAVPAGFEDHVQIAQGAPAEIVAIARGKGYRDLYIDGGRTVQRFLADGLIDEMILTEVPVLLGGGTRLFGHLERAEAFEFLGAEVIRAQLLQKRYRRKRP
ncbi:dihydrofolate reductase [Aliiruegeria haliotis]|uniref:Dihydrofolate reductase n=1 Tax=Aliiruegeria haliotis TaxID=1280846 RepID=A0A2T0RJY9_9RHOB|nr:dihydrofolate reductase family protein [Aliiruegeria haliotis]PRY21478.1 dihydrofolate reductase [Aliiruegeria haliotis]